VPAHVVVVSQTTVRRFAGPRMTRPEPARCLTLYRQPGQPLRSRVPRARDRSRTRRKEQSPAAESPPGSAGAGTRQVGGLAVVVPIFDSPPDMPTRQPGTRTAPSNDPPTAPHAPHPDGVNPPAMIANSAGRPGCRWCDGDGPRSSRHGDCRAPCVSMSLSMRDPEKEHQQGLTAQHYEESAQVRMPEMSLRTIVMNRSSVRFRQAARLRSPTSPALTWGFFIADGVPDQADTPSRAPLSITL
jgi:hypothetical protein